MYLINVYTLNLTYFGDLDDPGRRPFAALSHRWSSDEEELTFQEMEIPTWSRSYSTKNKSGYKKLKETCRTAKEENLEWAWIDTCCIDKKSSAELQEAINSMWRIYGRATLCMVYMNDATDSLEDDEKIPPWRGSSQRISKASFEESQWFTRGWTLQELLAPENVTFYSQDWHAFGTRSSLRHIISRITKIPTQCLDLDKNTGREEQIRSYSAATIMSWAAARRARRPEDRAYSLLGIFDVQMPLLYGEGDTAFHRLQMEIAKANNDPTLFLWGPTLSDSVLKLVNRDLLTTSPADFIVPLMCERPSVPEYPWTTPSMGVSCRNIVTFIGKNKHFACMWLEMPPLKEKQVHAIRHSGHTIWQLQQILPRECRAIPQDNTSNVDWKEWFVSCALWINIAWIKPWNSATRERGQMKAHRMRPMFVAEKRKPPNRFTRAVLKEDYEVILIGAQWMFAEYVDCMPHTS